ncbi:MAG TPA: hypothetical protein VHL57_04635, partial [Flavobacteriales bacterium]|nr:hypothetical protein [Flavobacteriales bacterium]
ASHPLAVGQFNDSQECNAPAVGDPCFLWNFPSDRRDERFIWSSRVSPDFEVWDHYVNIIVQSTTMPPVLLDGVDIAASFLPVPNVVGTHYAQLSIGAGEHTLTSSVGLWAAAYGFSWYNSYSFPLGYEGIATGLDDPAPVRHGSRAYVATAGSDLPDALLHTRSFMLFDTDGRQVAGWTPRERATWPLLPAGFYTWVCRDAANGTEMRGKVVLIAP